MAKMVHLPNMRVRQRSTKGKSKFKSISRGHNKTGLKPLCKKIRESSPDPASQESEEFETQFCDDYDWDPLASFSNELNKRDLPSLYAVKQEITTVSWQAVREKLRNACVESYILPDDQLCMICSIAKADMRCTRCGSNAYFCQECWTASHKTINIFHTPEVWENGCFKPLVSTCRINILSDHSCETKRDIVMRCLDEDGINHGVLFATCGCEMIAVTLARARLWPSTPKNPRYAYSFELLDWYEALLLECQVSLKDFCQALYYKTPHLVIKRRDIYEALIDSFEEYRFMKNQLRHLRFVCQELDDSNVCPACPKEAGTAVVSMDALFGLPRKRSAGTSHREPLSENLYFQPQNEVDEFLQKQSSEPNTSNECNSFMAGDPIRSCTRYHGLDETAVFGCACRHEIPLMFISLKHGERLGYAIYILQKVLLYFPEAVKVVMMYDIACTLQRYLNAHCETLSTISKSRLRLAIPIFHAYGHKAECQLTLSPLRCHGLGLSDGEVMERMWAFLCRFSRMTKEMRPSHRIDILSNALSYYAHKKKQKLHTTLKSRFDIAQEKKSSAQESFQVLSTQYELSRDDVVRLVEESTKKCDTSSPTTWEYSYFLELSLFYKLSDELSKTSETSVKKKLEKRIKGILERLTDIETKHAISNRWKKDDEIYSVYLQYHLHSRRKELKKQLRSATERRHFLLKQKAKYADGQKIAKKLSKQITKLSTSICNTLSQYNQLCVQTGEIQIALPEILNVNSPIWSSNQSIDPSIPADAKNDVIQSFLELNRCDEELCLIKDEISCVLFYYRTKISLINSTISNIQSLTLTKENNAYNTGSIALLIKLRWSMELLLEKAESVNFKWDDSKNQDSSSSNELDDDADESSNSEVEYSDNEFDIFV